MSLRIQDPFWSITPWRNNNTALYLSHGDFMLPWWSLHSQYQRPLCWDSSRILSSWRPTREISMTVLTDDAGCVQMMTLKALTRTCSCHEVTNKRKKEFCEGFFSFDLGITPRFERTSYLYFLSSPQSCLWGPENNLPWAPSRRMNWVGKRNEA